MHQFFFFFFFKHILISLKNKLTNWLELVFTSHLPVFPMLGSDLLTFFQSSEATWAPSQGSCVQKFVCFQWKETTGNCFFVGWKLPVINLGLFCCKFINYWKLFSLFFLMLKTVDPGRSKVALQVALGSRKTRKRKHEAIDDQIHQLEMGWQDGQGNPVSQLELACWLVKSFV